MPLEERNFRQIVTKNVPELLNSLFGIDEVKNATTAQKPDQGT